MKIVVVPQGASHHNTCSILHVSARRGKAFPACQRLNDYVGILAGEYSGAQHGPYVFRGTDWGMFFILGVQCGVIFYSGAQCGTGLLRKVEPC